LQRDDDKQPRLCLCHSEAGSVVSRILNKVMIGESGGKI